MSTSITINDWQIVIYQQKELLSELEYWVVEVWQDFDQLGSKARQLHSWDNLDDNVTHYSLSTETLESLVQKAIAFIKGENK